MSAVPALHQKHKWPTFPPLQSPCQTPGSNVPKIRTMYRVGQKTGSLCFTASNFRNIEHTVTKFGINHGLFILNICHNLFESTLENSGTIWRITLNVNNKVIKVMNWQWLCHAIVSAMLLTIALFCQLRRNFDDGRPSAEEHPDGKLTVLNPGYTVDKMFGSLNWRFSRCKFLCFWWCERERRPAAVTICNGHISPSCRVANLCQAPRHMVSYFPLGWMKTTLRNPCTTQRWAL